MGSQQQLHICLCYLGQRWKAIKATCGAIASFSFLTPAFLQVLSFLTTQHVTATFNKEQSKKIDARCQLISIHEENRRDNKDDVKVYSTTQKDVISRNTDTHFAYLN